MFKNTRLIYWREGVLIQSVRKQQKEFANKNKLKLKLREKKRKIANKTTV